MDDFCEGESFWDSDLTWTENSWPQLSDCFQNTVLQWVPCAWLLLAGPIWIFYLKYNYNPSRTPFRCLFCTKMGLTSGLILVHILDLIRSLVAPDYPRFNDEVLLPTVWLPILVLFVAILLLERTRPVVKSPVLFVFWILSSVAYLYTFYSALMIEMPESDPKRFTLVTMRYLLTTGLFICYCLAESHDDKELGYSPERSASMMSWLTFSWINPLIMNGYRNTLQDEDIFHLHPRDFASRSIQKFMNLWRKEKESKINSLRKRAEKDKKNGKSEGTPLIGSKSLTTSGKRKDSPSYRSFADNETTFTISADEEPSDTQASAEETKLSFCKVLLKTFAVDIVLTSILQIPRLVLDILTPFVVGLTIDYVLNQKEQTWHGYIFALVFVLIRIGDTVFNMSSQFLVSCLGLRIRATAICAVLRKALSLGRTASKYYRMSDILNLMALDSNQLQQLINYNYWLWLGILYVCIGTYFLYSIVGVAVFAGLGYILVIFVVNFVCFHLMKKYQTQLLQLKDERMKELTGLFHGIKMIKLYGDEVIFEKRVLEIRERELKILLKLSIIDAIKAFSWTISVFWMLYFIILTYVLADDSHHLDPYTAFVTFNFINLIRLGINILPLLMQESVKTCNSLKRIGDFLNAEDISQRGLSRDTDEDCSVRMTAADFAWDKNGSPVLKDISLEVKPGQLIAVIGAANSGKSALLPALLGEMYNRKGTYNLNSSVSYVPQGTWLQSTSLRHNILFGRTYDTRFYERVVNACSLLVDFKGLPSEDDTEVGPTGMALNESQKQRVGLARAVYSAADIYLLDDPLTAVDKDVGKHIFARVLGRNGILKDKTRLVVTDSLKWLSEVDSIAIMEEGELKGVTTLEEWMQQNNGPFVRFLAQYIRESKDISDKESLLNDLIIDGKLNKEIYYSMYLKDIVTLDEPDEITTSTIEDVVVDSDIDGEHSMSVSGNEWTKKQQNLAKLTRMERRETHRVGWPVYKEIAKAYGIPFIILTIFFFIINEVALDFSNVWLAIWSDDEELANSTALPAGSDAREDLNQDFLLTYTWLGLAQTFAIVIFSVILQYCRIKASRSIHAKLLSSVLHAPLEFFANTPSIHLLNRFGMDIEQLDTEVFFFMRFVVANVLRSIGLIVVISYSIPLFLAVIIPLIIVFYIGQKLYNRTSCQLGRTGSTNRASLFSYLSELLAGTNVIRACQTNDRFIHESESKTDYFQRSVYASNAVNKWIQVRLDILSYIIIGTAILFIIHDRESLSAGFVGLTITYVLMISMEITVAFRDMSALQHSLISVERIMEYCNVQPEAQRTKDSDLIIDAQWPRYGGVQFLNYSFKYKRGDLMLRNFNLTIQPGEKIAVVDKTGSGKSSLILALFRVVESSKGKILIDNLDVSTIGLHTLRGKMTLLPQDPVLFSGSLRFNLDPSGELMDAELWSALEHANLKTVVESLPGELDYKVIEGGSKFTQGQRKLLYLARALLRKTRIIVLDESGATQDLELDDMIHKTVRSQFPECTVLYTACRLTTAMDYDKVLVLDNSVISEFGSPTDLMADQDSVFYGMAKEAGLVVDDNEDENTNDNDDDNNNEIDNEEA